MKQQKDDSLSNSEVNYNYFVSIVDALIESVITEDIFCESVKIGRAVIQNCNCDAFNQLLPSVQVNPFPLYPFLH